MLADRVALMFDGVLQQFDVPRAFYDRPRSERVARFFRNENFLRGRKEGAHIIVGGATLTVADDGGRPDGELLLTVRPEDVGIQAAQGDNCVPARVHATVYMGAYTQFLLDVEGHRWRAHGPADAPYQAGDPVWLYLPPRRTWLLPAPEGSTQ